MNDHPCADLQQENHDLGKRIEELEAARNATIDRAVRYENALRPFVERLNRIEAEPLWREADDDFPVRGTEAVTMGELRAARAALARMEGK